MDTRWMTDETSEQQTPFLPALEKIKKRRTKKKEKSDGENPLKGTLESRKCDKPAKRGKENRN